MWAVVRVVRDHDVRGSDPNRPGMREVMECVRAGEVDGVIVFAMSRFSRDAAWQELTWQQIRKHKATVVSVSEPNIDHTLMRGVLGVVNQYRAEEIGLHISAAVRERSHRGLTWGRVPLGFARADGILVPDPVQSIIVLEIYRFWLEGASLREIVRRLHAAAIRPRDAPTWPPNTIAWILRNPVYAGGVRLRGQVVVWEAHEPIVTRETWEAAQARFTAPRVRDKPLCASWCEGHVIHSCEARMYLALVQRSQPSPVYPDGYPSFRCAHFGRAARPCTEPRQHIGQPLLEPAVRACLILDLRNLHTPEQAVRRARRESGSVAVSEERAGYERKLAAIAGQRREAENMVMQRRRDLAWLDGRDREFAIAEAALRAKLAHLPSVPDEAAIVARHRALYPLRQRIRRLDGEELGRVLAMVGVVVVSGDGVRIAYGDGYESLIGEGVTVDPRRVPEV
jgi:DNA invertase Pin-like site-specific DNA recombinase